MYFIYFHKEKLNYFHTQGTTKLVLQSRTSYKIERMLKRTIRTWDSHKTHVYYSMAFLVYCPSQREQDACFSTAQSNIDIPYTQRHSNEVQNT